MTDRNKQQLNESLARLRSELENADEATRRRLAGLVDRLERQLAGDGGKRPHPGLFRELEEEVMYFEVEHPRLTGIINDIMVALSNMGI